MNRLRSILIFSFVIWGYTLMANEISFNDSWLFLNEKAEGAEKVNFDDSNWRSVTLPHDWAIEGPFDVKYNARCGGLPFHGTGWYRKRFKTPENSEGKIVRIEFEGAMYNAHIWINGEFVGNRPYGYIGFEFDITSFLNKPGENNVIAVRLTPEDLSSRWYPGAGIYRNVWLKVDESVHIANWGTYITTPTVTNAKAAIQNETVVVNKSDREEIVTVKHEYFAPDGKKVATIDEKLTLPAKSEKVSGLFTYIKEPLRWDLETPNLYKAVTSILNENEVLDVYETKFGIRTIEYNVDGFYLNGKKVRFNGVCLHHDNGALGAAVYKRADERKLQIMKDMGVNAIRTSHNPPSEELLDLCDEMGLMVQDEAFDVWEIQKVENGYNKFFNEWAETDLKDMVRRDRNHPSIVMWSIGNEIIEQKLKQGGWRMAKMLNDYVKEVDPTRPTTAGFNNYSNPYDNNMAQQVDIAGMNYKPTKYSEVRENYPQLPIYGSETSSCTSSRGVYHLPIEKYKTHESKQVTSYDLIGPPWAYPPDVEFHFQEQNPFSMGEFIWTGFDYLGEPTPYGGKDNSTNGYWNADWPSRSSYFGAVDLCGFPKDRFYLYQSHWTTKPMIHLLPHWNWTGKEGAEIPVYCYTNCDEAELFLNGKSLGKKVKGVDKTELIVNFLRYEPKTFLSKYRLSWMVPYEKGELKVIGIKDGKQILEQVINTAAKPAKIRLSVDRPHIEASNVDLAYVTVQIEDKNGNICPLADNLMNFSIDGVGDIVGVDNGNAASVEPFQANYRKAFNGKCLVIVKSTFDKGSIKLKVTSKRLKSAEIEIVSR